MRIHNLENEEGITDSRGKNPLSKFFFENTKEPLNDVYNTYDWKGDKGFENMGDWVDEAARIAKRR